VNNLAHRMTNQLELEVREFSRTIYNESAAFLFKVPEELQQTPVDFFGFTRAGRAVLIECKQVRRTSLPVGDGTNGLQGHQWNALELAHRCGAVALLVWRRGADTLVLPFDAVLEATAARRSIPWQQPLEPWADAIRRRLL
jgi:hypothetical protein